jgi:hypothetical protein
MSLELPAWVTDAFNLIGLPWPGIDEDQLRAWAGDVRSYAAEIASLLDQSRSAVAALSASNQSAFAKTLESKWDHYHGVVNAMRAPMEDFAGALDVAAGMVVAQKIVVIGAAVALAGEVIATQGEALVTFGLAEAEVPAEVAAARLIVRGALQELEGYLLGVLINKATAELSGLLGGAIGRLVAGGGQVAAEAVVLKADYDAAQSLASALGRHGSRVQQASGASWRRASSRELETGGPGGGWREVARAVEQAVLRVMAEAFIDLGRAIWTILKDTAAFLRKAVADLRHTDTELAAKADRESVVDLAVANAAGKDSTATARVHPVPGQTGGGSVRPKVYDSLRSDQLNRQWANDAYETIRASDDVADVAGNVRDAPRLDGSTGFTLEEIRTAKAQVFYDEHPLEGDDGSIVYSRFDADPDIAEAWLRLRSGNYKPQDLILLEHELAEHNYWEQHPEAVYWDAHGAANSVAFWSADLPKPTYEDYTKPWK